MKEKESSDSMSKRFALGVVVLFVAASISGCSSVLNHSALKETELDSQLSKSVPPAMPKLQAPGEPQQGFSQDPKGTRN